MFFHRFIFFFLLSFFLSHLVASQTTFTDVASSAGIGLADGSARGCSWVDFNNDGLLDLYVPTGGNSANKFFKNNGDGTFTDIASLVGMNDIANTIASSFADMDNDGDFDLITTAVSAPVRLWRNNLESGDTTFTSIETNAGVNVGAAQMPTWADFNNDGFVDFYISVSNSASSPDVLYKNNGDYTFTNVAEQAGVNHQVSGILEQATHWGDFNRDGFSDLFISNLQSTGPSFFHKNNGNGTFSEIASSLGFNGGGRGAQWFDFNNDGFWDFCFAPYAGGTTPTPIQLFKNNGDNSFTEIAAQAGITDNVISWGVTTADYDNNGFEDIFVTCAGQNATSVLYKNNGNGTFTKATAEVGIGSIQQLCAAWGDFNNDGCMDLYSTGSSSYGNHLFKNNGNSSNHWLKIKLVGTQSNKSGIGAQISVKIGTLRMLREINSGSGYRSQNMPTAHFGLNNFTSADSIIVQWQSGTVDILSSLSANQTYEVVEGGSVFVNENENTPPLFSISQNYPNPFNPTTTIRFEIPVGAIHELSLQTTLKVFDILGREVTTLLNNEELQEGEHEIEFDASKLSSGMYFYRLQAGKFSETKKMLLMK
ncbi:MAG: T9SS type A sorting domain-containing protein [Ignavibacteria bacterium]|nr:T9SS type A sorting domain-containing protein [Ignavibacteria bacterium]